ncbi:ankyrin repeat domain-containing protein 56 [Lasius niger]|uniref:Ankyrin repeat domain-containing protein 56 n=1 Tax=Lasius niger TaxID=67767 RepID=A0A0J7NR83_LASNI|nr:ankyrin repeat domain-containing protein 56 [Lasius niger]
MATPGELSLEEIRNYLLENGGTARNHDLVKHFKRFLTDPETRVEARNRFKEYVNTLATIKNEEGDKYLVLKKKYRQPFLDFSPPQLVGSPATSPDLATPVSPLREPPPYRPPPPAPLSPLSSNSHASLEQSMTPVSGRENEQQNDNSDASIVSVSSPPVPPRRKSQDKLKMENKENVDKNKSGSSEVVIKEDETVATTNSAEQLSVRERMQRFNRMASETDLPARPNDTTSHARKRADKGVYSLRIVRDFF